MQVTLKAAPPKPTDPPSDAISGACAKAHTRPIDGTVNGRRPWLPQPHSLAGWWGLQSPASASPIVDRGIFLASAAFRAIAHFIPDVFPLLAPLKRPAADWTGFRGAIARATPRRTGGSLRLPLTHQQPRTRTGRNRLKNQSNG